jgi:hypothetical protein
VTITSNTGESAVETLKMRLQSATLQARMQGATIFALTPDSHALSNMAAEVLPLASSAQAARYALLMLVDLLNDTLIA